MQLNFDLIHMELVATNYCQICVEVQQLSRRLMVILKSSDLVEAVSISRILLEGNLISMVMEESVVNLRLR